MATTGVQTRQELRQRTVPAVACTFRCEGGDAPGEFGILAAEERDRPVRAGFGKDRVSSQGGVCRPGVIASARGRDSA